MPKKKTDHGELTFEEALNRLENAVERLESPELKLAEALELFQSGVELANICNGKLAAAEQEIKKISEDAGGGLILEPWTEG